LLQFFLRTFEPETARLHDGISSYETKLMLVDNVSRMKPEMPDLVSLCSWTLRFPQKRSRKIRHATRFTIDATSAHLSPPIRASLGAHAALSSPGLGEPGWVSGWAGWAMGVPAWILTPHLV